MARNCGGSNRSAAARMAAMASRRMSGGGIETEWVTPLSSVRSQGSSPCSRRPAGTTRHCCGDVRRADRRSARRPDRTDIARRAAGRTPSTRTARGGCRAEWRSRAVARATRNSRRKAAQRRAGIGRARSSASRRRRPARRLRAVLPSVICASTRGFVLLEGFEAAAAVIVLRREGIAQHAVDALPGGEHLRAFGGQGDAAIDVEELARFGEDAEVAGFKSKRLEARDQLGLRHDARAASGKLALHALEDIDGPAPPPQHDGGQEPAHRAADHQRAPPVCHARSMPKNPAESGCLAKLFQKLGWFSILCP